MLVKNVFGNILLWAAIAIGGVIALYIAFIFINFLILFIICLTASRNKKYKKFSKFYYGVYLWASWMVCHVSRVKIHFSGLEKVPFGQRFVLISNHRSNFDNIVQGLVFKKEPLAYISKPENFKLPFVGRLVNRCLFLAIQRGNVRSGLETILEAINYIKSDLMSIGIYPEGTRSKDCKLQEFKPGCLKVAEKAGCPMVIVATRGTEKIHKNVPFKRTHVYIDVIDVIPGDQCASIKTVELGKIAYEKIRNFLIVNDVYEK